MRYEVVLSAGAERDLEAIYAYIAEFDCRTNADHVLDQLSHACECLADFPERGAYPKELRALGIREYRQTILQPYRVMYRIFDLRMVISLIADGQRDMQSLLSRRLIND